MLQHERDGHFVFGEKRDKMFVRPIALQLQAWKASGGHFALCALKLPVDVGFRGSRSSRFSIFYAGSISIIKTRVQGLQQVQGKQQEQMKELITPCKSRRSVLDIQT